MRSAEWIVSTYRQRKAAEGPNRQKAAEISAVYDGLVHIPLPELDENENAAVANLLTQGLDQMAMRVSSVFPNAVCPPTIPGQKQSENNARIRRLAVGAWWQNNRFDRKQRKRSRWLIGYAASPVIIRPNKKLGIPRWELRDPLCTYAAPMPEADEICPDDCIFGLKRSFGWIAQHHPDEARVLNPVAAPNPDELFEVLEFIDADEHVLIAVGKPAEAPSTPWGTRSAPQGAPYVELARFPNLVGRCTVVNPTRISLNNPRGQFDQMPGLYQMQARMMALSVIATERSIFPDLWFVSRPQEIVQVIERPDGRAGVPGQVKGGDLKEVNTQVPPMVMQMVEQMERNMRVTAGISQDFGGENPTNTRTARAGEQLLKATVDYWVQEAQETLGMSYSEEAALAIDVSRSYFGNSKKSFYVNFKGIKGSTDYTPNVNFDSNLVQVAWPFSGSDANALAVRIGQKLGLQVMSKRTAMELDPDVEDEDLEESRIAAESLDAALLASIDQMVAAGQINALEVSRMGMLVRQQKMSPAEAFWKVHEETQELQKNAMAGQAGQGQEMGAGPGGLQPGLGVGAGGPPGGPNGGPGGQPPGLMSPALQQQLGTGPNNLPGMGPAAPTPGVAHMAQLLGALKQRPTGA